MTFKNRLATLAASVFFALPFSASVAQDTLERIIASTPLSAIVRLPQEILTDYTFGDGFNLAFAPIRHPDVGRVLGFLHDAGVDINHVANDGRTPIHFAIDNNELRYALKLIVLGADLEIAQSSGRNAVERCLLILRDQPDYDTCELVIAVGLQE